MVRALRRDRVDQLLDRAWSVPLTVVMGPAGAGKTTAVGHLVERSPGRVLWYRASAIDGDESQLCAHLAAAMEHAHGASVEWTELSEAWQWLSEWAPPVGAAIVIDEFDAIVDEPVEQRLATVIADAPTRVHTIVMSRRRPGLNLSRLQLGGLAVEVGPDDLRFRSWEVDRLFRELYGRPLSPDQAAELERRTGGWVAALQLFDLATAHLPEALRDATISRVGRRSGPDWDYLAENVLAGIAEDQRAFLLDTAPLERLDADLCDELRGTSTSARTLADLERSQLLTVAADDPSSYRCHEVLRSHLEALLVESDGEESVRKRCSRAARFLERRGRYVEALRAYCRADDRESAHRLLSARGGELAENPGSWLDRLPSHLVGDDPWLLLARARQCWHDGRLADAVLAYERVEAAALSSALAATARTERFVVAALADARVRAPVDWVRALRAAGRGDLRTALARPADLPVEMLVDGLAHLVAGDFERANRPLRAATGQPDATAPVMLAARVAIVVNDVMAGRPDPAEVDTLERMSSALDAPFFGRLCGALRGAMTGSERSVPEAIEACERRGDEYGAALCEALGALALFGHHRPRRQVQGPGDPGDPSSMPTSDRCRRLGLDGLGWWVDLARAAAGLPTDLRSIEVSARRSGALGVASIAGRLASDRADGRADPVSGSRDGPHIAIRCFGGLEVAVDGVVVDIGELRPRARAVLSLLAVQSTTAVHRDVICGHMWPDDDVATATGKLHVAVSSIRRVLRHGTGVGLLERTAESYLLAADPAPTVDVAEFWTEAARAEADDGRIEIVAVERLFDLRRWPLLPEQGAADWLVDQQRRVDEAAVRLAHRLAEASLGAGNAARAATWARRALDVDRWSDGAWRLLIAASDAMGDSAGAARAHREYATVLADLGVGSTST